MGQQVKSWCRQHERLLIFLLVFLLLSGLSLYFCLFSREFFYEQVISAFIKNRVEGLASAIKKTTTGFLKINYFFLGRLWLCL